VRLWLSCRTEALTEFNFKTLPAGYGKDVATSDPRGELVAGEALARRSCGDRRRDDRAVAECDDRDDRLPPTLVSDADDGPSATQDAHRGAFDSAG